MKRRHGAAGCLPPLRPCPYLQRVPVLVERAEEARHVAWLLKEVAVQRELLPRDDGHV